jgi:hypothetical protein
VIPQVDASPLVVTEPTPGSIRELRERQRQAEIDLRKRFGH